MSDERMYPGDADLMSFSLGDLELTMVISDVLDDDLCTRSGQLVTFINVSSYEGLTTSDMLVDDGVVFVEHPIRFDEGE